MNGITDSRKKKESVIVRSAIPLKKEELAEIEKILKQKLNTDLYIKNEVDQSLIAGIYIRYGDQVFDASLRSKIDNLKERLLQ